MESDDEDIFAMENLSVNFGGTKWSDLRRLLLCFKLMLIWILLSLPCIFAHCQGVENLSVAVYPMGNLKVHYGDSFELFCVAEKFTSADIEFTMGGKTIPSEVVNSTTIRLYMEKPEKQVNTFYCRNKKTNKICTSRVVVDSTPMAVTDFSCKSKNLEILNCTWIAPGPLSTTQNYITFLIDGNAVEPSTPIRADQTRYWNSWNTYSIPRYRQMENKYYFYLSSCSPFGCNNQSFTVDHFSIVKPDAPSNLKVIRNYTNGVYLQWNIPNNMVDLLPCGVDHRIEYQIDKIDNKSYFRSVDASSLPPKNRTYKFLLTDLPYAHMKYEIRIYIKSKAAVKEEFWSDFTYTMVYTLSERPRRPPDTAVGAFDQSLYQTNRMIYIYWKQLEEYEEAGTNFTYKVVVHHKSNYETLTADNNKSLSFVVLEKAPFDAMDVYIWSRNDNGSSINSSHLYIPPKEDTEALKVSSFTKLAYENGAYKLSWVGIEHIDNYTLFWCQHNSTKICAGRMNFIVLSANKTMQVIELPRENRYQFAISANNGTKTSGMVWAICDISKDAIPMYGFPVKMDHGIPGKTFVKIKWAMTCTLQEGIITGYLIAYCPALDTTNVCATKNKTNLYISNPKQMEINITNLEPYTTYIFTLALNTTYGFKTVENAFTSMTTTEDTPTSPVNINITDVLSDSLTISWDPPIHKNGVIGKYVINNYGQEVYVEKVSDKDEDSKRRHIRLTGLQGFTNYSLSVQACSTAISSCSVLNPHDALFVRTRIGPPSKMRAPTVKNNPDFIKWVPPIIPGGTIDLYQIKRIKDESEAEIINTTNLSFSLIHCEGGVAGQTYQVRAVNFDEDPYHGALTDNKDVYLHNANYKGILEYPGEWSEPSFVNCTSKEHVTLTLILMGIFMIIGIMYGFIKCYKKYRKMEDIKPVLPSGLGVPEKDISKYAIGGWNPTNKDEKPSSDEMLLLPNSRTTVSSELKQKENNNSASSDHTDSTALSDTSHGPVERQISSSDDGSNSSLHLEVEPTRTADSNIDGESCNSETETSQIPSPFFNDNTFKKNPCGYVQQSVVSPNTGYVQSVQAGVTNPPQPSSLSASSSYVMAALSPPIFTTRVAQPCVTSSQSAGGYVHPEGAQTISAMNFPKLGQTTNKLFGPESLPTMQTLPPAKHTADSSYIQLQSLDSLPRHKHPARSTVPLKTPASTGYVRQGDAVINKHLNNMLSGVHCGEESAILDPAMSPDAYCRFSWSTDPANDNIHSLLADSPRLNSSKNGVNH